MKDYKKILEGVVNIVSATEKRDIGFDNICSYIDENCPELKESEDEKIRKALLHEFIHLQSKGYKFAGLEGEEIIAWLVKQGQKEATWNKEDEENMNNVLYILNQLKDTSSYEEDNIPEKAINWFKSLKERLCSNNEYDKDMLEAIEYCKKNNRPLEKEHLAWLEKHGVQEEPQVYETEDGETIAYSETDGYKVVEPKFHEGDWIINGTYATIMQVVNNKDFYESVDINGQRRTDTYKYMNYHSTEDRVVS